MVNKDFYLLDCTLRDGGYVNEWGFDFECAGSIISKLYESKIEIIECGILGKTANIGKTTKFNNLREIEPLLFQKHSDCIYTIMLNYAEKDNFIIEKRHDKTVDGIRIAFFKSEAFEAIEYGKELMNKGYLVFLQAMVTSMYSKDELINLVSEINKIKPFSFSLVDSFGTLYNNDMEELFLIINDSLSDDIVFGFHAHNNIQMAFSNAIKFIELGRNRKITVDATVYGMGRGAGNVNTELLMQYLNEKHQTNYNISKIIDIFETHLSSIYKELYWGYSLQYFTTAKNNINPAYAWYFSTKGIQDVFNMNKMIDKIPIELRYSLNTAIADKIIAEFK